MDIIDYHNAIRKEENLPSLCHNDTLTFYCLRACKWMARRRWNVYWNFDYTRKRLMEHGFKDVDFNIAVGDDDNVVIHHIFNNSEKRHKILSNYTYIGYSKYRTNYMYWTILYAN